MKDPLAGLDIKKGCQEVDGETALAYARSRHDREPRRHRPGPAPARGGRRRSGHEVFSPWTVINPVRWWRLNMAIPDFFVFGEGGGPLTAGKWALAMTRVDGEERPDLRRADPRPRGATGTTSAPTQLFAKIIADETDDIPKGCARRPAAQVSRLRDPGRRGRRRRRRDALTLNRPDAAQRVQP